MTNLNLIESTESVKPLEKEEVDCETKQDLMSKNFPTLDKNIKKLFNVVNKILPTNISVLLTGEHGVGKEKFAKAIHVAHNQIKSRFIEANCSNLPTNFFELELFGVPKTHFLDSETVTPQYFEICTLLLDEVTNLDKHLQFALLRVLREQEKNSQKRRYTGTALDARVIACSIKNLQAEVNAGRFNAELFSKLSVIHIEIPSLRNRMADIDLYADMFINEFNTQYNKHVKLTITAKQSLRQYTWPGNIRELKNILHRATLLGNTEIDCTDLKWINVNTPTEIAMSTPLPQVTVHELEQRLILQTLRRYNGNRTHTAKALSISLRTLRYKLKELIDFGYDINCDNEHHT